LSTRLTGYVAPALFGAPSDFSQKRAALAKDRREKAAAKRMEQSYEVLGETQSDEGFSGEDLEEEINGEEVRSEVEFFVKNQLVQTALAGVGFMMAVVGIWGDGVYDSVSETVVVAL
jgi:autophagy-related protein 33